MSLIEFNKEQKLILNEIRKFTQTELEPLAEDIDRKDAFPAEIIKKLTDLGLSGIVIPEQYGGAALDTTSLCIVLEELARASAAVSTILFVNNCLVAYPLMHGAVEDKKKHHSTSPQPRGIKPKQKTTNSSSSVEGPETRTLPHYHRRTNQKTRSRTYRNIPKMDRILAVKSCARM